MGVGMAPVMYAADPGLYGIGSPAAGQPSTSEPSACLAYTSPSLVPKTMSALPSPSRSASAGEDAPSPPIFSGYGAFRSASCWMKMVRRSSPSRLPGWSRTCTRIVYVNWS